MGYTESVLRYPGGKRKVLNNIIPGFPEDITEYREPFIGGGSIFVRAKQLLEEDVIYWINDANEDLILFWKFLQEDGENLIKKVRLLKSETPSGRELYKTYWENKEAFNEFERAVWFFIMNRITFSGLTASGGYSQQSYDLRFTESIINKMQPLSELLQGVRITNLDYSALLKKKGKDGTFIFMDPPYLIAKSSHLYGVKGDLHTTFNHEKFAKDASNCRNKWLMTCEDSKEMREYFSFAKSIIPWNLSYGMTNVVGEYQSPKPLKRGRELLVANYDVIFDKRIMINK